MSVMVVDPKHHDRWPRLRGKLGSAESRLPSRGRRKKPIGQQPGGDGNQSDHAHFDPIASTPINTSSKAAENDQVECGRRRVGRPG